LWSSLFHCFLKPPVSSFLLAINIYLRTLLLNTLNLCSSLRVRDQDKIIMKCRTGSNDGTNGLNYKIKSFIFLKHHYRTKVYHAPWGIHLCLLHYRSIKKNKLIELGKTNNWSFFWINKVFGWKVYPPLAVWRI